MKCVDGLKPGIYHYLPGSNRVKHSLELVREGDFIVQLADSALGQDCIRKCAVAFVIGAVVERTTAKYGARAERYVFIETGHAAQNLCLQAAALGLGAVTVGAFYDDRVKRLRGVEADPTYIIPVGLPAK